MMSIRLSVVVALFGLALAAPTAARADQPKALVLPIAGNAASGAHFSGTVAIQRFVARNGAVFAIGVVSGSLSTADGPVGTSLDLPVAFPVHIGNGVAGVADRRAPYSAPSGYDVRAIFAQSTTCGVLHLDLGAVNLNLLGVVVTTTPVTIDINGDTGGPLGNLVCAILSTVNNVVGVVNLLNSLLSTVTGLVGGLTGGLGGAALL